MSRYTYTLNPDREKEKSGTYRRSELEKMTTFHLREICRRERLVIPSGAEGDREGLIRLIMRFRGQKEYRHIISDCEGGLDRLQAYLQSSDIRFSGDREMEINVPGSIVLYEKTGVEESDGYVIHAAGGLYEGNLLLVDEKLRVYTCFYIRQTREGAWLFKGKDVPVKPLDKHRYSILYFPKESNSEFLYDCYYGKRGAMPGYLEGIRIPLLDIQMRSIETTALPLVVDFGSSNTTMGICLPDGSTRIAQVKGMSVIPTVLGVKVRQEQDGKDGGEAGFLFGQEARELERETYRDEDVAVFYDIKRWISDPDRTESVILQNGYKYQFTRKEMLRAYLDYLLMLARQQFKCSFTQIQFLAPICQKEKFRELFKEILSDYTVHCELDEGMAVLFHSISHMIREKSYEPGRWYHALTIDCGGGTTDLTSGRFRIENNRVSYSIDLETRYENGDTNFGGNNLTYRILQMLKIRLAEKLGFFSGKEWAALEEEEGAPYEELERRYRQAEAWIPTRFKEYEERGREQYFFVKNNYYYLFHMAELIKMKFFQSGFRYELRISTQENMAEETLVLDKWKLSVCPDQIGKFEHITREVEFSLYIHEVEAILGPDIYSLMERFLDRKFREGELSGYEMIKMTGQSCKSALFTEALKQYVPGKLIQNRKRDGSGTELKMCCLEGALSYFLNCKLGYMKVNQDYQVGSLPYEIMALTHENREKILVKSLDPEDHIGYISRFRVGNQLDLYLYDDQGRRLRTYHYGYDSSAFHKTTQEEIDLEYAGTVIQEETDIILEGEMKFFVWVSRKRWGFVVLPVLRSGEQLYRDKEQFFDFEDDTWELNFFDGRK